MLTESFLKNVFKVSPLFKVTVGKRYLRVLVLFIRRQGKSLWWSNQTIRIYVCLNVSCGYAGCNKADVKLKKRLCALYHVWPRDRQAPVRNDVITCRCGWFLLKRKCEKTLRITDTVCCLPINTRCLKKIFFFTKSPKQMTGKSTVYSRKLSCTFYGWRTTSFAIIVIEHIFTCWTWHCVCLSVLFLTSKNKHWGLNLRGVGNRSTRNESFEPFFRHELDRDLFPALPRRGQTMKTRTRVVTSSVAYFLGGIGLKAGQGRSVSLTGVHKVAQGRTCFCFNLFFAVFGLRRYNVTWVTRLDSSPLASLFARCVACPPFCPLSLCPPPSQFQCHG